MILLVLREDVVNPKKQRKLILIDAQAIDLNACAEPVVRAAK